MISLSSDEVMLVPSTFLESSPWLVVTLPEPLSHHRPCSGDCRKNSYCRSDAQRRAVYPLIDVVQLSKFWRALRVVLSFEGVLIPPPRIIDQ